MDNPTEITTEQIIKSLGVAKTFFTALSVANELVVQNTPPPPSDGPPKPRHKTYHRLTRTEVKDLVSFAKRDWSTGELANHFNVHRTTVRNVLRGRSHRKLTGIKPK
jgi:hypothetical protein